MVIVKTKEELKNAISRRDHILVTNKNLVKKLTPFMYVKKGSRDINSLLSGKSNALAGAALSSLTGLPIAVAITLIITVGVVVVIAILSDYKIKRTKDGDIELEPA